MRAPRGVEQRIDWFLSHHPGKAGMCARHSWQSLGGDYGNPPRWGAPDANAVYDKIVASKRFFRGDPPKGALVVWRYGRHGHAAISLGGGMIATTDPTNQPGQTGIEPIAYPQKWGARIGYRIWTDEYNGVRFPVGEKAAVSNNFDYQYLGKPTGPQTVGMKYEKLDDSRWDPPRAGFEHTLVYLNVKPTFAPGMSIGSLRVRIVRADGDATGYNDFVVAKDALEDGVALFTYTYWELGDGKPTHVEARCQGGLALASIGTRYTKKAVVVD